MSNDIDNVIENGYCVRSGSYAVIDRNVTMAMDSRGEYTPIRRDTSQSYSDNLEQVCAMSNISSDEYTLSTELFSNTENIKYDTTIGYYLGLYAGYVVEGDYRKNASSGGLATWIFKELLEKKLIDGVIHVAESNDSSLLFDYTISRTVEQICAGSKTRYYPVEFSEVLKFVKESTGRYAIIGLPSFITEIRLLAKQDKIISERIKYTLGLICGHQKSAKYAEAMAWQYGYKPGDLKSINFRHKIPNRSASKYATELKGLIDNQLVTKVIDQNKFFVSNWGHGFFKSKFSDFTDDSMNETADVSLGDAWLPEYESDGLGNNVLIVRNFEILKIISAGITDGRIKLDKLSPGDIIRSQSGLIHHIKDELPYRLYKVDKIKKWRPKKRVEASADIPLLRKLVQDLRQEISTQSHLIYEKAVARDDWTYFEVNMAPYIKKYNAIYKLITVRNMGPENIMRKSLHKIKQNLRVKAL